MHCSLRLTPTMINHLTSSNDYAQSVHYTSNLQQPGPAYFKSAWKCCIFGVTYEPLNCPVNYLIVILEKGPNATVSMLVHFLSNHGIHEANLSLHAGNCVGQSKNFFMHYLLWPVMTGLNDTCTLSFMLLGHTKFAPDLFFGLIKRKYRCTLSYSNDIVKKWFSHLTAGPEIRYRHWSYLLRTIPFQTLMTCCSHWKMQLHQHFIPALTGRPQCSSIEKGILALPVRLGPWHHFHNEERSQEEKPSETGWTSSVCVRPTYPRAQVMCGTLQRERLLLVAVHPPTQRTWFLPPQRRVQGCTMPALWMEAK